MFHRLPSFSIAAATAAALIFLLVLLFASSHSSPGTALAEETRATTFGQDLADADAEGNVRVEQYTRDDDFENGVSNVDNPSAPPCDPEDANYDPTSDEYCPQVSVESVTPEVGEEGRNLRVTLNVSRDLTIKDDFCYRKADRQEGEACIQGGILIWDTYNDHLYEDDPPLSETPVKFVFRGGERQKRLTVQVADDECVTPGRTITIAIRWAFRPDDYGYTIEGFSEDFNTNELTFLSYTVPINGNDAGGR